MTPIGAVSAAIMPDLEPIPAREPLPGTVKFYGRHLVLCTGADGWPTHIEEDGGFLQALNQAIQARSQQLAVPVKLTACDAPTAGPGFDLLVFPDRVRYLGLTEADFETLVTDHLIENRVSERLRWEPAPASFIFVCTHGARDARCGECGPPLLKSLAEELAACGLQDAVRLHRSSHVGGHKYAGNVLVYPPGDWYGYASPADAPRLVRQAILDGQVVADLWRGRMGLRADEAILLAAQFPVSQVS